MRKYTREGACKYQEKEEEEIFMEKVADELIKIIGSTDGRRMK